MNRRYPEFHLHERHLCLYRDRTRAILRRYFQVSIETGRLPSLLGKQFFRARVTSYRSVSFEDAVIFVTDVESCINKLNDFSKELIALIALQGYQYAEAAQRIHCSLRTVERSYPAALDQLSEIFLQAGVINFFPTQEVVE